ncbi:hypothetical protein [Nocardia sputorum]|uniref:Uncharacterized protein n=1 Tax=Nocardia sputorum TaxID=2984338 RepID=A0ABN6TWM2_9NOCA|nr:hypothetical protein [Nocardia sputorum]BDT97314.1 hypothetical protein IFM12276_03430 [Nocardia sputorum]
MSQPLPFHHPIIIEPPDAPAYLAQMDIAVSDVHAAIATGEIWAGNMNGHHPVTAAGLIRWIYVVGTLRERLAGTNLWFGDDPKNRPISQRTDGAYTLSTVGGNEITGIIDHPTGPFAARRRGKATAEAVNGTAPLITIEALRAGNVDRDVDADLRARPPHGPWFLVYFRDEESVRMEISLPLGFEDGQFTGWKVRVILDEWRPERVSARPRDVGGQDVDFQVIEVG